MKAPERFAYRAAQTHDCLRILLPCCSTSVPICDEIAKQAIQSGHPVGNEFQCLHLAGSGVEWQDIPQQIGSDALGRDPWAMGKEVVNLPEEEQRPAFARAIGLPSVQ